jgi:hypothetical protein
MAKWSREDTLSNIERELYEILEDLPLWEQVEVDARRMQGLEELDDFD